MKPAIGVDWFVFALKNYVGLQGRSRRKEFWYFVLFQNVSIFVGSAVFSALHIGGLSSLVVLGLFLPGIAVAVRRLHDTNRSGWWLLLPVANIIFCAQDSDRSPNRYGVCPKDRNEFDSSEIQERQNFSDNLDQLERLAKLRDQGILTSEEFNAKKATLL